MRWAKIAANASKAWAKGLMGSASESESESGAAGRGREKKGSLRHPIKAATFCTRAPPGPQSASSSKETRGRCASSCAWLGLLSRKTRNARSATVPIWGPQGAAATSSNEPPGAIAMSG